MRMSRGISRPTRIPIDHHDDVENQAEALGVSEGEEQQGGGESADHADQQLDPDEAGGEAAVEVAGKGAADPHGEQIAADDGGELKTLSPRR